MSQQPFYRSKITGTGSAFPKTSISNHQLAKQVDTSHEWILERTGIKERRIAETGNSAESNSSLGYQAALQALEMANKKPTDLDQILYATCSPDTLVPSTACWVQKKLGATNAWSMDLNAACSGFLYALHTADQFIRAGQAKTILVIGADILSAYTNWTDRSSCILFGDAAGAVIVERTDFDSKSKILSSHLHSNGDCLDLFQIEAGGSKQEVTPEIYAQKRHKMQMKGKEIFKIAVRTLSDYAIRALEANHLNISDIDWFIPHQANLRIIEAVAKKINFPMDKVLINLDRYGNTSSATIPTVLDESLRLGRIQKEQLILFDVFGAGLTYGSMLLRW